MFESTYIFSPVRIPTVSNSPIISAILTSPANNANSMPAFILIVSLLVNTALVSLWSLKLVFKKKLENKRVC